MIAKSGFDWSTPLPKRVSGKEIGVRKCLGLCMNIVKICLIIGKKIVENQPPPNQLVHLSIPIGKLIQRIHVFPSLRRVDPCRARFSARQTRSLRFLPNRFASFGWAKFMFSCMMYIVLYDVHRLYGFLLGLVEKQRGSSK